MHGKRGLKKNTKKAIKLFERAAELGNQKAQSKLACNYLYGISVPKCLSKARYYAEKAAEQGENTAQYLLAELIEDDNNREEELFQLRTLAEFQGLGPNRYSLGMYYTRRYQSIKRGDEGWMRNLLLSVYWFGKSAEVKEKEEYYAKYAKGCRPLTLMSLHLDEAMRVWHPRPNKCYDPLPGYSHIPFCTWALAKRSNTELSNRWNRLCANCGTSREKDTLKACARCKAFYYCCKKCQVEHWKAGHKVDCKVGGHWIEQFFPEIRNGHE
jgi:TPR repeat protein